MIPNHITSAPGTHMMRAPSRCGPTPWTSPSLRMGSSSSPVSRGAGACAGGRGTNRGAVPKQVIRFLNNEDNRSKIRGVVGGGNRNYGKFFCYASEVVSKKCSVPLIGKFEVFGLPGEAEEIREAIDKIG